MGITKSKIPNPIPGRILFPTGIAEYDIFYSSLEPTIKVLEDIKSELNYRITELIQELRIEHLWYINPSPEILVNIILTLLAVAGNGVPQNVANFTQDPPYFIFNFESVPKSYSRIFEKFEIFTKYISSIPMELFEFKFNLNQIQFSERIQNEIMGKTIEQQYDMNEKLMCIRIVNRNHEYIKNIPKEFDEFKRISGEFCEKTLNLIRESQNYPHSEILLHRGIQCIASNQMKPKDVVKKFWPLV